ncbi:MAG: glycoside hydrolase family 2 protein, partial [Pseudomonadota bacterium]
MRAVATDWSLDLSGAWRLRDGQGEYDLSIDLPDDVISALHEAELIPDPYWGRNEYDLRWIAEREWIVSRTVDLASPDVSLYLAGLDTVTEVRVNGQLVLETQNAHRRYSVDLSTVAVSGENAIEIR